MSSDFRTIEYGFEFNGQTLDGFRSIQDVRDYLEFEADEDVDHSSARIVQRQVHLFVDEWEPADA